MTFDGVFDVNYVSSSGPVTGSLLIVSTCTVSLLLTRLNILQCRNIIRQIIIRSNVTFQQGTGKLGFLKLFFFNGAHLSFVTTYVWYNSPQLSWIKIKQCQILSLYILLKMQKSFFSDNRGEAESLLGNLRVCKLTRLLSVLILKRVMQEKFCHY